MSWAGMGIFTSVQDIKFILTLLSEECFATFQLDLSQGK